MKKWNSVNDQFEILKFLKLLHFLIFISNNFQNFHLKLDSDGQEQISTAQKIPDKKRKRVNDFNAELKEAFENSAKFSKKEEDQTATSFIKTRILPATRAEVLMNQSNLFRGQQYRVARILISRWAALERKCHQLRLLSPMDDADLASEAMLLIEYSKFQNPNTHYWCELVSYNLHFINFSKNPHLHISLTQKCNF